jgi:deoxycytidine triphosphate deaminase
MARLAEELFRALRFRLNHLEEHLSALRASFGASKRGPKHALAIIHRYPGWLLEIAEREWGNAPDEESRVTVTSSLLTQASLKSEFVDEWFGSAASLRIPAYMTRAVERGCDELGIGPRHAVLALGSPVNFETYPVDLTSYLFGLKSLDADPPDDLPDERYALMRVPQVEGGEAYWLPLTCGHELGHLALAELGTLQDFDVGARFDWTPFNSIEVPVLPEYGDDPQTSILGICTSWVEEILCDFYAARRYGPAGIASLAEFLSFVGAMDLASPSHPPGWFRLALLLGSIQRPFPKRFVGFLEPWEELMASDAPSFAPWAKTLVELLWWWREEFEHALDSWPFYDWISRDPEVGWAQAELDRRLPPRPLAKLDSIPLSISTADVVNALWVCRSEEDDLMASPIGRLAAKALDTLELLAQWQDAGGSLQKVEIAAVERGVGGVLSETELTSRLESIDADALVITPLLNPAIGAAGIDIRLGSKFIVFPRTGTASFDPLGEADDPRTMQDAIEKAWGEDFVLHPGELVLATTLEFLALPPDLSAHVITRSSFGRLGLITATAVAVQPYYHGCLTLELVNLGEVPLHLTPGERIAQLVFMKVDPQAPEPPTKYECPTGPEFSKVRQDSELGVLRNLRKRYH